VHSTAPHLCVHSCVRLRVYSRAHFRVQYRFIFVFILVPIFVISIGVFIFMFTFVFILGVFRFSLLLTSAAGRADRNAISTMRNNRCRGSPMQCRRCAVHGRRTVWTEQTRDRANAWRLGVTGLHFDRCRPAAVVTLPARLLFPRSNLRCKAQPALLALARLLVLFCSTC